MTNIQIVSETNAALHNDLKHAYPKKKSSLMLACANTETLTRINQIRKTSC